MSFLSDIEIAQQTKLLHIKEIADRLAINEDDLELDGKYKAKLPLHLIDEAKLGVPLEEIGFNPVLGFNQDGVRAVARSAVANDNFTGLGNAAAGGF